MASDVLDLLQAGRKVIEKPESWIKGFYSLNGCFCAEGALLEVCDWEPDYFPARDALEAAIPEDADFSRISNKVAAYNDDEKTTHADILALFDRAIAAEMAKVGA